MKSVACDTIAILRTPLSRPLLNNVFFDGLLFYKLIKI